MTIFVFYIPWAIRKTSGRINKQPRVVVVKVIIGPGGPEGPAGPEAPVCFLQVLGLFGKHFW